MEHYIINELNPYIKSPLGTIKKWKFFGFYLFFLYTTTKIGVFGVGPKMGHLGPRWTKKGCLGPP